MQLVVSKEGDDLAAYRLKDGYDNWNSSQERKALDHAYEIKEGDPQAFVTIVLDWEDECHASQS